MDFFGLEAQLLRGDLETLRRWLRGPPAIFLVLLASALGGCHTRSLSDTTGSRSEVSSVAPSDCAPGRFGCSCDTAGANAPCGNVVNEYGDYVTCAMGRSTCKNGIWSACNSATLVTRSFAARTLDSGGIHVLTTSAPCADKCDPSPMCIWTTSSSSDVDAAGIVVGEADGSVTVSPITPTACQGLECQIEWSCAPGTSTTLTGIVYDPAGVNPLYDATVYIPLDPKGVLPPLSAGASCGTCANDPNLNAVAVTKTGPDGTFTLHDIPSTDVAPNAGIPLVIQMGKWRREEILASVPKCVKTAVAPSDSRLPRNHSDGNGGHADLPKIAIVTGAEDPFECLLLKMGVDPAEFQAPASGATGANRVDYYVGNGSPLSGQTAPSETALESDPVALMQYDLILLPSQGESLDMTRLGYANNLAAYANAGGRIFATHASYDWLAMTTGTTSNSTNPVTMSPNPFFGVANWNLGAAVSPTVHAAVNHGPPVPFPKGGAFDSWLQGVGALDGGIVVAGGTHGDIAAVNESATAWMDNADLSSEALSFSFGMPPEGVSNGGGLAKDSGASLCGRVFFSEIQASAADRVAPGQACQSNSDCGLGTTCAKTCGAPPCYSSADCNPGFACVGGVLGLCHPFRSCQSAADCQSRLCTNTVCTVAGRCAPDGVSACGLSETCGGWALGSCKATCSTNVDCPGTEICIAGACQGCATNADCPSNATCGAPAVCSGSSNAFPWTCTNSALTPQEKAIEFMFFDLAACISPDNEPPPVPAAISNLYSPATFTETFTSSCTLPGTRPKWRRLDWDATIPPGSSIEFSAQTGDPVLDGGPATWSPTPPALLANALVSTVQPLPDFALIDVGTDADSGPTGALLSGSELRLTVTLKPTDDRSAAPTLNQWRVTSDCEPSE